MDAHQTLSLDDRLRIACTAWCVANDAKPGRLGRLAINDGGFFTRLEKNPCASTTTATLGKFAQFLVDAANWPEGKVAEEAKALAHVVGVSPVDAVQSAGKIDEISQRGAAA